MQKQSGANTVEVVERVRQRLEQLKPLLPPDIETFVVKDQSRFIVNSIDEVNFHLVIAAVLVALTILLFIHDWRTTIIASLAIPASIIATFAFMYWMGYTLNNMTMLGLILAIGIVIDDAVVINENIFRHMEEHGSSALEAAGVGHQGNRPGRVGHDPVAAGDLHPGGLHGRAASGGSSAASAPRWPSPSS